MANNDAYIKTIHPADLAMYRQHQREALERLSLFDCSFRIIRLMADCAGCAVARHPARKRARSGTASCLTSPRARGRAGAAKSQGDGRSGRARQVRVPGHDEPRDPHADEHRHRHDAPDPADPAAAQAAQLLREGGAVGQRTAVGDQ
ncbi:hypothetical protein [Comamonas sp. JC664]|uniref:hypothetical protein n=1 Tax=Comamonas sp. JC664 TaxID=2801917 RepID=UPI00360C5C5A